MTRRRRAPSSTPTRSIRRRLPGHRWTRSRRSSRASAPASRSPSTATTTSTASARRPFSSGPCASLAPTCDWFIPDRKADGYGLQRETVEMLAARGTKLLITVDCAITAVEEVRAARELGLAVVVTDHHTPRSDGVLPDCADPAPRDLRLPRAPSLCATAVAWKARPGAARSRRKRGCRAHPPDARPRSRGARDGRGRGAPARREPGAAAAGPRRALGGHLQARACGR